MFHKGEGVFKLLKYKLSYVTFCRKKPEKSILRVIDRKFTKWQIYSKQTKRENRFI